MEIDDKKIFKIALLSSLIGILGMLIFSSYIEPKEIKINEISRDNIGEKIAITGIVESIKESSNSKSSFITLNDGTSKINIILFESTLTELKESGIELNSFKNQRVKVIGSITEYKSTIELILANSNSIKIVN